MQERDRPKIQRAKHFGHRSLYHYRTWPLREIRPHPVEIGNVSARRQRRSGDLDAASFDLDGRILREHRSAEGIDQMELASRVPPVERVHDGGTDKPGVDAA